MRILGIEVSDKTAALVTEIKGKLSYPVRFFLIEERPGGGFSFGSVDPSTRDGFYKVWLKKDLPQEPFETNALHELRHIVQIEADYPQVYNKDTPDLHSINRDFIMRLGSRLSSILLDIDVNVWLAQNGYSDEYFSRINLENLIAAKDARYPALHDPLNYANLVLALLQASIVVSDADARTLFDAYSTHPKIVAKASALREKLLSLTLDNATKIAYGQGLIIDALELWGQYFIMAPNLLIRTRNDFRAFCEKHISGTDTSTSI